MFPERIETERLVLERLCRENLPLDELYELFSGEGAERVFEHLAQSPYRTPKEPEDSLQRAEKKWEQGERAEYAVRERDDDRLVGTTALFTDWERRTGRLGLILHPSAWGRGYSAERAEALTELAFERLDLQLVAVTHGSENEKSRSATEKYMNRFGGGFDCHLRNWYPMDDGTSDERRYTITREQYADATG